MRQRPEQQLPEGDFLLNEVDTLIAAAEARIERHRQHVRSVAADFDASMKAISQLETMNAALAKLHDYRARLVGKAEEPSH